MMTSASWTVTVSAERSVTAAHVRVWLAQRVARALPRAAACVINAQRMKIVMEADAATTTTAVLIFVKQKIGQFFYDIVL